MTTRKVFFVKVALPFLFASVMCAIFYGTQHNKFPKDASPEEWGIFVRRVLVDIQHTDKVKIMLLVLFAHVGHTVFCVPCVHLTQMLAGYCLGFFLASVFCAICECTVVTIYVLGYAARNTFAQDDFDEFVTYIRRRKLLFPFIFLTLMSSVPINSSSCIIGFGQVTPQEFMYTHYVVSIMNSCKCCLLGQQIRVASSKATVVILGYIIFAISLLPTLITVILWYLTFVVYRRNVLVQPTVLSKAASHACQEHETFSEIPINNIASFSSFRFEKLLSFCRLFHTHKYNVLQQPSICNDITPPSPSASSPRQLAIDNNSQTPPNTTHDADVLITTPAKVQDAIPNEIARTPPCQSGVSASEQISHSAQSCATVVLIVDAVTVVEPGDSACVCTNAPLQVANMTDNAVLPAIMSTGSVLRAVLVTIPPECIDCLDCCKVTSPAIANSTVQEVL